MYRTDIAMFRVCCLVLFLVADTRQLSITKFSVPQSVEVGNNAELQCAYDLKPEETKTVIFVKWWWRPLGEDKRQIYQRTVGFPAKSTQHIIDTLIKDNDTLVLLNVQPSASGIYECEVSNIEEVRKVQELIVYSKGSGPRLNISDIAHDSKEDKTEKVLLECEASDVAPLPDLLITIEEKEANTTKIVKKSGKENFYYIFANATVDKALVSGGIITCELYYKKINITDKGRMKDVKLYDKTDKLTSTKMPENTTDLNASTPVSLPNSSGTGSHLYTSIFSLVSVLVMGNLFS